MAQQASYDVQLVIYDLSHGMARNLSAQFLGPNYAIEIIPHSAIVIYGTEYFFGGGIQQADPNVFRSSMGIHPVQVQSLGKTSVSKSEFDSWCNEAMRSGRWSAESYDLLHHNCNNFCHDAATQGLKLPRGVPEWVLEIPQRFLSSPMGQMVRPMLENMQITGPGASAAGAAPFANMPFSAMQQPPTFAATTSTTASSQVANSNPWANIPSSSTKANSVVSEGTTKAGGKSSSTGTPTLDGFSKPFVSGDIKTVALCVKKLSEQFSEKDVENKAAINEIGNILTSGDRKPSIESIEKTCSAILDLFNDNKSPTFALMLLRIIVLNFSLRSSSGEEQAEQSLILKCMKRVQNELTSEGATGLLVKSAAARSMAWVTCSNAISLTASKSSSSNLLFSLTSLESLVGAAMNDILAENQERAEVRQAAATFLYNLTLHSEFSVELNHEGAVQDNELSDLTVSMLCGSMENITEETDATTRLRRLMVATRIVKPVANNPISSINNAAKQLIVDLGFRDCVTEIASNDGAGAGDALLCKKLASEFASLLYS